MDLHNSNAYTRRAFIGHGVTFASAAVFVPAFLQRSAAAMAQASGASLTTSIPGVPEGNVLVVIQLGGGNDGLNTVIPYTEDAYHRARNTIAIRQNNILRLNNKGLDVGLHPALSAVKDMYDNGLVQIMQGVGYPNPNRSHFASMDIWQTADTSGTGQGWLGRYFDNTCSGSDPKNTNNNRSNGRNNNSIDTANNADANNPVLGIAIGRQAPLAMQGRRVQPVAFDSAELFRWSGAELNDSLATGYEAANRRQITQPNNSNHDDHHEHHEHSTAAFLTRTAMDAQLSSDQIRRAAALRPLVNYPRTDLARQLALIAQMIRAGLPTRVYYATLGGFDTHAGQGGENGTHANLLRTFAEAVSAFYNDLKAQRNDQRVMTMSFSEFGRRVGQNASGGTDHGAAAPMMLFGPMVRPGVIGDHPSLKDLDAGDLKFNLDFRSVYAGVLTDWLNTDPQPILQGRFRPCKITRTT